MRISNPKDMGGNKLLHRVNVATDGVIQGEGTETSPLTANVDAIASNVFPAFSGNSGKVLRVNANETGTEWAEMTSTSGKVETVRYVSSVEDYEAICALASSAGSGGVVPFVALNDLDLESDDVFDQGTETVSSSLKRGHTYVRIDAEFTIYFPSESGGTTHTRTVHTTTYFIEKFWLVNQSTGAHVDNWALYAWRDGVSLFYGHPIASEAGFESGYGWKNRTEVYDYMHWLMNGMWPTVEVHERPEAQEASLKHMIEVDGTYLGTNPDMLTGVGTNGATLKRIDGVWRKGNISRDSHMNLVEYFDMDTAYSIQFMYRTSSGSSSTTATPMSTMEVTEKWKTGAFEIPEKLIHLPLQLTGDITPGLPRKAEEVAYATALEVHPGDCLFVSLAGNMTISALDGVDGVRQTASIDIMPGTYSVTAGQNLAIIGSLTVDKLNHCEVRWWGKEATLHALYVEEATSGGSSSSSSSESSSDSGESQKYVYTVTGATDIRAGANGDYYATGEELNGYPVYTNGEYFMYYFTDMWTGWTIGKNTSGGDIYTTGTTDPIGEWTNGGVVVSAYSGSSSSSSGTTEGTITVSSQTITGTAGTSLSYNLADYVTVSNGQTPTFTLASGQVLPTGLSLSSNGVISGTPEASSSATIRVKVSASNCPDVEMTVTFNIAEAVQQGTITITNNPKISGVVGTAITPYNLSSVVTVSNGMTPSFSWNESYYPKPTWLTLTETGVLSGTPSGIPEAGRVTVSADNCTSVNLDIAWDIINAGTITVGNQTIDGTVGNAVSLNLSSSTTVSNGQTPTFAVKSGNTLPAGVELSSAGVLSGTPTATSSATVVVTITARGCPDKEVSITFNITEAQGGETPSDGWPTKIVVSNATSEQGSDVSAFNGEYTRTGETLSVLGETVPIWSNGSKYIYGMSSSMGSDLNEPAIALQDSTGQNDAYMSYYYRMKSGSSWERADAANAIGMTATITEDYTSGGESGGAKEYVYTLTGATDDYAAAAANGDYYATGEIKNTYPVYTNGTYFMFYIPTEWQGWTVDKSTSGGGSIYKMQSTDPIGYWYPEGVVVSAYSGSSSGGESSSSESGGGTITFPTTFSVTACSSNGAATGTYTKTSNTTTVNGTDYPVYSMTQAMLGTTFYIYVCQYRMESTGAFWTLKANSYSATDEGYSGLGSVAAGGDGLPSSTTWTASSSSATVSWT